MEFNERILKIREQERLSHIQMYSDDSLDAANSWVHKPVKTVLDLLPRLNKSKFLHILDLGCGIGRNSIPIAQFFRDCMIQIDCIDILDIAIEKLEILAEQKGISDKIHGMVNTIDEFDIPRGYYDLIITVSALEHVSSFEVFSNKLEEIRNGLVQSGIACLILHSEVHEVHKSTGIEQLPQFEVNLSTEVLESLLFQKFSGYKILKNTKKQQQYEIPREDGTYILSTTVVTYIVQNE